MSTSKSSSGGSSGKAGGGADSMKSLKAAIYGKPMATDADEGLMALVTGKKAAPDPQPAEESKKQVMSSQTGALGASNMKGAPESNPTAEGPRSAAGFQQQNNSSDGRTQHEKAGVVTQDEERRKKQDEVSWDGKKDQSAPAAPKNYDQEYAERVANAAGAPRKDYTDQYTADYKKDQEQLAERQRQEQDEKQRQATIAQQQQGNTNQQQQKLADDANKARNLLAQKAQVEQGMGSMSDEERRLAHGQLEDIRIALAQLQYYG